MTSRMRHRPMHFCRGAPRVFDTSSVDALTRLDFSPSTRPSDHARSVAARLAKNGVFSLESSPRDPHQGCRLPAPGGLRMRIGRNVARLFYLFAVTASSALGCGGDDSTSAGGSTQEP